MNKRLVIAYRGKNGSGFGRYPWLLDEGYNESNIVSAVQELKDEGFTEVYPFWLYDDYEHELEGEDVTDKYVREHLFVV